MIKITFEEKAVSEALRKLAARSSNLQPALKEIGVALTESTKQRFGTSTGPDGQRWAANAQATIARHLGRTKGNYKKSGGLSSRGAQRLANKKPLVGETLSLSARINYRTSTNSLEIGSPMIYAAIQQFGGKAGRGGKVTIPARPFLGVSSTDAAEIVRIVEKYLKP